MADTRSTVHIPQETTRPRPGAREVAIADIAHLLVSENSPSAVLDAVADALAEVVPHDALTLYSVDSPRRLLRPSLVRDARSQQETLISPTLKYGEGIVGAAAESGKPRLVTSTGHSSAEAGSLADPQSLIVNPLMARGELKGVLCLHRFGQSLSFRDDDLETVLHFSTLAALAIDNADIRSRLENLAMTDHLTGLYNHRYFQERLLEEVSRATRRGAPVSLIIYDIDDFKDVNDSYGHLMGDEVIKAVASAAGEVCRIEDPVCRIGGEEFAVIVPGLAGADAQTLAERIRRAATKMSFPMGTGVTVSVGLAEVPTNASSPRDLFACADLALRTAKAQGKNCVRAYSGDALRVRRESSHDYPLADGWEILTKTETGVGRASSKEEELGYPAPLAARLIAQMKMLHSLSVNLGQVQAAAQVAETIRVELKSLIDYETCQIYLPTPDAASWDPVAPAAEPSPPDAASKEDLTTADGRAIAAEAGLSGRTIYFDGTSSSELQARTPDPHLTRSLLAVPLRFGDQTEGVIVLTKVGTYQFDEDDIRLLELLSPTAGIALEKARMSGARDIAAKPS